MKAVRFSLNYLIFRNYCSEVRVRFAPSPTGFLHLGGLRTALYNYLLSKQSRGKFVLRIEDTDQKRLIEGAAQRLENDLTWIGIVPDESPIKGGNFGPYVQSERNELYKNEVQKLLANGSAYYCFCTERRLELLRKNAIKNREVPKYDNHCRNLSQSEIENKLRSNKEKCVRFKLTSSKSFKDLIFGEILYQVENIEGDPVIFKKDGLPTYHLASVIDDHYMQISHVIRGVEWLQSTNKHLMIYSAFGYKPPTFAHLPLLLNSDGSKLSKRQNDITISALQSSGVEPRALVNFISSVGGGFKDKPENASIDELPNYFNITLINSNSTKLPLERLKEYNNAELMRQINSFEINLLITKLKDKLIDKYDKEYKDNLLQIDSEYIKDVLIYFQKRINYLDDLLDINLKFLWVKPKLTNLCEGNINLLKKIEEGLDKCNFVKSELAVFMKELSKREGVVFKELMHLMRDVLCGIKEGPGVAEMMELLGKQTSLERIHDALSYNSKVEAAKS